ncbi:MAG: class I SAM-dependent methyltransferase [Paraperlucidibaca sp.]
MSLALYCLEQTHADVARVYAESLGAMFHAAWPEQHLAAREFNQHRRRLFAGLQARPNELDGDASVSEHSAAKAESVLIYDADGLALQTLEKPLPGPVRVDFADAALQRRISHGHGAGEAVARACGLRKGATPRVLDATAGLGRDSWILASLGAQVEMVERVPLVHALLADGLRRARLDLQLAATAEHMQLLADDAQAVLQAKLLLPVEARPEVVYLDPMFPHRDKSAKVKKDMWAFRHVVGSDTDADALLDLARAVASKRVVVKRPRIAPDLNGEEPHQRMLGQSSRFDLYTPKALY